MTGHLLGAASALESIICIKSILENKIPPNINIDNFDEKVPLKCINTQLIEKKG